MRASLSPERGAKPATTFFRQASSPIPRLHTCVVPCSPCDNTASAALMKGWISSIFMRSGSRAGGVGHGAVFTHHVLDNFVQHFRLHRLLHEMPCSPLPRRHDVFLV